MSRIFCQLMTSCYCSTKHGVVNSEQHAVFAALPVELQLDQPLSRRFRPFCHRLYYIVVDIFFVSDLVLDIFVIHSCDLAVDPVVDVFFDWIVVQIEIIIFVDVILCYDSMTSCADEKSLTRMFCTSYHLCSHVHDV